MMESICCVIDFEGFYLSSRREFLVREIGYIGMDWDSAVSLRFNLSDFVNDLSAKDWKTISYVKHHISGLTFRPLKREFVFDYHELDACLLRIYNLFKTHEKVLVAYKGGNVEREKLTELNIPSVNLEEFGCPKFKDLCNGTDPNCGYHVRPNVHCPRAEVLCFRNWINENMC